MANQNISYSSGHPWYYKLGGQVPSLKAILKDAKASGYRGYREEEITLAEGDNAKLRAIKNDVVLCLRKDISQYRKYALKIHGYRKQTLQIEEQQKTSSSDVHMSMSLKRNHIYNGLAHLVYIDELLSRQPDLFDF